MPIKSKDIFVCTHELAIVDKVRVPKGSRVEVVAVNLHNIGFVNLKLLGANIFFRVPETFMYTNFEEQKPKSS